MRNLTRLACSDASPASERRQSAQRKGNGEGKGGTLLDPIEKREVGSI
jgi:hypothetical protein